MNWFTGLVVYALTWWVVLFAILPIGIRRDENPVAGQDQGAPVNPRLGWRFFTTTWVAALIWIVIFGLIHSDLISFRSMAAHM